MDQAIDIIIPAYNATRFIVATLDSIQVQTTTPHQIIVVDDGSTDTTHAVVTEYSKTSKLPIVIVSKTNGGLSSARNAGIAASTSPLIAFLDADDLWQPTKLEKQLAVFATSTYHSLGLVYCDYSLIDNDGNADRSSHKTTLDMSVRGQAFKRLLSANKILSSGSGVLIKKNVFDSVGNFDETLRFGEDWDMWLRIAKQYYIDFVPEALVQIRRHDQSMTANTRSVFIGEMILYKKWLPILKQEGYPIPFRWWLKVLLKTILQLPRTDLIKDALPVLLVPFR